MTSERLTIREVDNGLVLEWDDYAQVIEKDSSEKNHLFSELGLLFYQMIERGMESEEASKIRVNVEMTKDDGCVDPGDLF